MQKPGVFIFNHGVWPRGHSLVEVMLCLSLLAVIASVSTPVWWPVASNTHLESARDALMNDVQTARVQALQLGVTLKLSRLSDCAWAKADNSDWSCGWQLQRQDTQGVLRTHAIHAPMQVLLVNQKELFVGARGEIGSVGTRWFFNHPNSNNQRQYVVCLNSAGRLRWQSGATCA